MNIKKKKDIVEIIIGKTILGLIRWEKSKDTTPCYSFSNKLGKNKYTTYRFYPKTNKNSYLTMSYYKNRAVGELINTIHFSDVKRVNEIANAILIMDKIIEGQITNLDELINLIDEFLELLTENDKPIDIFADLYEELIYFKMDILEEGYFLDTMIDGLLEILESYQ